MELFYTKNIDGDRCFLDEEESRHCVKVLRHRKGEEIEVIDGLGTLLKGVIEDDSPKCVGIEIKERITDWGGHPYRLDLAVCPPKNADRYEWFVEKACEIGVDSIIPVIGDHSERRVLKTERLRKLAISAAKQSLKAYVPEIREPLTVKEFINETSSVNTGTVPEVPTAAQVSNSAEAHETASEAPVGNTLKLFAFCFEVDGHPKLAIRDALALISRDDGKAISGGVQATGDNGKITNEQQATGRGAEGVAKSHIIIMIGPEGDFSPEEAQMAMEHGFTPIHLGTSRLRTETAALLSAVSVYTTFI